MYRGRVGLLVLAITVAASTAVAHVAPSVDDNNRYLKVTPGADRVRLAYTVFFGEVPGAQMRRSLDANHDGTISDDEGQAFANKLAAEVADALDVTVDGKQHPIRWATVAAGMGTPQIAAGSFSIDLVAWVCLPSVRGAHVVQLRDRFRLTRPGETELKVEDSPGVTIQHARVGRADDPSYDYRFAGPGGPLMDDGLDLAFVASDKAPLTGDGSCAASDVPNPNPGRPTAYIIGAAAVLGFVLAAIVVLVQRRKHRVAR
jgi:hypothetical protein